jgi:hypothetical protein
MFRPATIFIVVALVAHGASGATLQAILKDQDPFNTTPGAAHRIQIWVKDAGYNGTTNLGLAQAEFEILSSGSRGAQYLGTTSFLTVGSVNPLSNMRYTVQNPTAQDGTAAPASLVPLPIIGAAPDGDLDAIGLSFSAPAGAVVIDPGNQNFVGTVGSPNNGMVKDANGFQLLAIETWSIQQNELFNLYIDSASAAYFGGSFDPLTGTNTSSSLTPIGAAGIDTLSITILITVIPEPTSLVLMTLGGLALIMHSAALILPAPRSN